MSYTTNQKFIIIEEIKRLVLDNFKYYYDTIQSRYWELVVQLDSGKRLEFNYVGEKGIANIPEKSALKYADFYYAEQYIDTKNHKSNLTTKELEYVLEKLTAVNKKIKGE